MPASFLDLGLCKSLLDAVGNGDFGVLVWPLSVLLVLRRYQVYLTYGLTTSIVVAFFIGQVYLAQIQHSVAVVHAFAIRLQGELNKTRVVHELASESSDREH